MFITFEGVEGSGKSLQVERLFETLRSEGKDVIFLRDPGGTPISEKIREVVLGLGNTEMARQAELLLYLAARAQLVAEKIKPSLSAGKIVVCDRFSDSTYAYQVYGRGFDLNLVKGLNEFSDSGIKPDLTFFLDMPVGEGLKRRAQTDKKDRLDLESVSFYEKVREGYKRLVAEEPKRWVVVDGRLSIEEIKERIWEVVESRLHNR